ncbi:hypothetical protein DRN72_01305 [Methanosarcinales archaeon]|nr:MAG: hypothetical protein DRN72_01305 [Methanosarcinales archaeon]
MMRNISIVLIVILTISLTIGSVDSVYTDDKKYELDEVAVITVLAEDGDTVSVQVSKKKGHSYTIVWNSSA